MPVHAYRDALLAGHWFRALPRPLQDNLLEGAQVLRLDPGQCLFRRGDPPNGLYAVVSGTLRICTLGETGKEALLTLVEPPHWLGEIALFDGQARTHDAFAEGASTLLRIPQSHLLALLDAHPGYWRDLALLMSQKLRLALIALEQMSLLPAAQRLARRLLLITDNYGEAGDPRQIIHLAQEQLALMLAISRQTTNQLLKELEAQGILRLAYGEIEILDLEGLRDAAR